MAALLVAVVLSVLAFTGSDGEDEASTSSTTTTTEAEQNSSTSTTEAPTTTASTSTTLPGETTSTVPGTSTTLPGTTTAPTTTVPPPSEGDLTPLGETARVGDWEVTLEAFVADGTAAVAEADTRNPDPPAGFTFSLAHLTFTYVGSDPDGRFVDLEVLAITTDGQQHSTFDQYCGVAPDEVDLFVDVQPGESTSGNVCLTVPSASTAGLVVAVQNWTGDEIAYFATD